MMNSLTNEIEAKFYVESLPEIRQRLLKLGARVQVARQLERNIRYDTPRQRLKNSGEVLRLRTYDRATLTYKRRGDQFETREEIETEVADPVATARLLAALGFEAFLTYEKHREVFRLEEAQVTLDELPFGSFAEIEAATLAEVRRLCETIGLAWDERVTTPYLRLIERLEVRLGESLREATFERFQSLPSIGPEELGLRRTRLRSLKDMKGTS